MLEKMYAKTYHDDFHKVFPGISPCTCHQKHPFTIYEFDYETGETVAAGRIVKEVTVQCGMCGKEETFNVESREVFEEDMKF